MRKTTLFAAAFMTAASIGLPTLKVDAGNVPSAQKDSKVERTMLSTADNQSTKTNIGNKNIIIIKGNSSDFNLQSLLEKLQNCYPSVNFPNFPQNPDNSNPTPDQPDNNLPDVDLPDMDFPDFDQPDIELPDVEQPDTPDADLPDIDLPDTEIPTPTPPETDTPVPPPAEDIPDTDKPQEQLTFAQQVVELVNKERAKAGLSTLSIREDVTAAAQVRAVEIKSLFSHTRPDGTSFATALKEQNVSYRGAGENIAWGQKTPEQVMEAWMNSEGHRANIMNANFTSIGVGYYQVNGVNYWTQLFTY